MPTEPAILPLWPRPGVQETLEWMTYVQTFEDGTEERTSLRVEPRQAFRMSFYVPQLYQRRVDNILYGARGLQWWVPVWPQVQQLGAIVPGATTLDCETRYSEFREGGYVMLWESPTNYQLVGVEEILSATQLELSDVTQEFTDAWLMPLRYGRLTQNPSRSLDGKKSVLEMAFEVDDNAALTVPDPDQYLSDDFYFDPGLLDGGSIPESIVARIDEFDEGLGLVSWRDPWVFNRPARVHRMMGETPAETWAIRKFLHRRFGKDRPFWQPSFERDFVVTSTGALTTQLRVQDELYRDYAADRTHIAVQTASGWLPRAISSTTDLGGGITRLNLDSSLAIDASDIKRVCFLGLKRLDTDRAEINWIGNQVATCSVSTTEIAP